MSGIKDPLGNKEQGTTNLGEDCRGDNLSGSTDSLTSLLRGERDFFDSNRSRSESRCLFGSSLDPSDSEESVHLLSFCFNHFELPVTGLTESF